MTEPDLDCLIIGGGLWWANKQKYEATDNAFIAADKVAVAPQVDGYVAQVLVEDNQRVAAGQVVAQRRPLAAEHLVVLGWVMLMIVGVAYHVLPRFSGCGSFAAPPPCGS